MSTDTGTVRQSLNNDVMKLAADYAQRYAREISERRVAPSEAALAALADLHEPFPTSPSDASDVIARLDQIGSPATIATTGGPYLRFGNGRIAPPPPAPNSTAGAT